MTQQESKEIKELKAEIEALKKDLSTLTETLSEIAQKSVKEKSEEVTEKILSQIPEDQLEQIENLKAQGEEIIETVKAQQAQHPMGTLAVAAGIGFLLGKLFGTKS
jgi:ElaB/YqjD/DUF883 family membrane-anchored ribosome-binding protein